MKKNTTKRSLLASVLALVMCVTMLVGTTFAWFTDSASTSVNRIQAGTLNVDMTFTAPSCPAADYILEDVRSKLDSVDGVKTANVNLVFEPAWDQSMMSEEARVELGFE